MQTCITSRNSSLGEFYSLLDIYITLYIYNLYLTYK